MKSRHIGPRTAAAGLFLALLATLLHAGVGVAQEPSRIVGRVTDGAGNPVRGARVVLVGPDSSTAAREVQTGETGGFEFAEVRAGTYTLRAEHAGRSREQRITVTPGERRTVIARLVAQRRAPPGLAESRLRPER